VYDTYSLTTERTLYFHV